MEKWMRRTIELGAGLVYTGKNNPSVIPYYPQKTKVSGEEKRYFQRSTPEQVGITSGRMLALIKALEKEKRANVHSIMVIKDNQVICECSHPGYSVNTWHLSHSMSKTVTGMAIGMLVDDGLLTLDRKLIDLFPEEYYRDKRFAEITVKHLLTMSSGVRFFEAGAVSETEWTDAFFDSPLIFKPGEDFNYNSMNSYILARIVYKLTGRTLTDFLRERLLEPLHIDNFFWEVGPEGSEKGGWGIYMSCESWAKLGVMMLNGGTFEGRRILSKKWVKESTSLQIETPTVIGNYNYGYQLWVERAGDCFLFNGMLGQNVWVCPKNNMVVSLNSGNNELFQNSPALAIIERYMGQTLTDDLSTSCFAGDKESLEYAEANFFKCRHWVRPYETKRGISYRLGFRNRTPYPEEWEDILGKYSFSDNNLAMLPLFVRGMQNNLRNSIPYMAFEKENDKIFFIFKECDVEYRLEVGFYDFKETVIDFRGEKYIVKVIGEAMEDEDRNMLYKLELLFPELPNTRMLKFSFMDEGQLMVRFSENPNAKIADAFLKEVPQSNTRLAFVFDLLEKRIGKAYAQRKLAETFSPVLIGARVGAENYNDIMAVEAEKQKANEKTVKLINTIIDKFIHEEDDDDIEEENVSGIRTFFGDIMDRIKAKMPPKSQKDEVKKAEEVPALESPKDENEFTEEEENDLLEKGEVDNAEVEETIETTLLEEEKKKVNTEEKTEPEVDPIEELTLKTLAQKIFGGGKKQK